MHLALLILQHEHLAERSTSAARKPKSSSEFKAAGGTSHLAAVCPIVQLLLQARLHDSLQQCAHERDEPGDSIMLTSSGLMPSGRDHAK
jgi:hypothetical protein